MGMLIGASCLTLIEVLDLIIYNCILKCLNKNEQQVSRKDAEKNHQSGFSAITI